MLCWKEKLICGLTYKIKLSFGLLKTFKTRKHIKSEVGSPIITGESAQKIKDLLKVGPSEDTERGKEILKEMFKNKEEPVY